MMALLTRNENQSRKDHNSVAAPSADALIPEKDDPYTLARLITEAVTDVRTTLRADPHLRLLLKDLAAAEDVDAERTALEVDGYVAGMVGSYLSNKRRKPRVRFPRIRCMSVSNLQNNTARCVVSVKAWGHTQRFTLDLELPND